MKSRALSQSSFLGKPLRTTVSRQSKPPGELDKIRKRKGLVLFPLNFDGGLDSDTEHPFKLYTSGREGTLRGRRGDIVLQDHVQSGASGFTRNLHIGTLNSMRRKVGKECASCELRVSIGLQFQECK